MRFEFALFAAWETLAAWLAFAAWRTELTFTAGTSLTKLSLALLTAKSTWTAWAKSWTEFWLEFSAWALGASLLTAREWTAWAKA